MAAANGAALALAVENEETPMPLWAYWVVGTALGLVVLVVAYVFVIRPWHMSLGTIGDEFSRPLPGDELVRNPKLHATHAITINASAAEIWPWLVQFGQARGGWYSYTWLENLFGCQIKNANVILPEFQNLQVGDAISLHPKAPALLATVVEPSRAIVIATGREIIPNIPHDPSFLGLHRFRACTGAYILDQQTENSTRFIGRMRCDWDNTLFDFLRTRLFLEPAHSIMQEKMNRGIKKRVERGLRQAAS